MKFLKNISSQNISEGIARFPLSLLLANIAGILFILHIHDFFGYDNNTIIESSVF